MNEKDNSQLTTHNSSLIKKDAISHRLTERIKELVERYETPLPKLTNEVADLTSKVENHLKKRGYEL